MRKVDLRVIVLDVPKQDVISRDNVSVKVNAVVYFRIVDPGKAIIQVANPFEATSQLAQTTLRSVLGQHEMDDLLAQREKLNVDIQRILDQSTEAWGIKVSNVEIKHVDLDETMIRAMAKQAEAERTRRAKIIHAEGESQAAQMLVQAAASLAQEPGAMQLRYLQTLADISSEKTSTIVFPLPLDLIKPFLDRAAGHSADAAESAATNRRASRDEPFIVSPGLLPRVSAAWTMRAPTSRTACLHAVVSERLLPMFKFVSVAAAALLALVGLQFIAGQ